MNTHHRSVVVILAILLVLPAPGWQGTGQAAPAPQSKPPLHEISYYPRNHAWLRMWTEWDQARGEMDQDLDVITGLGANTVRIFVPPAAFPYPNPTITDTRPISEALALIAAHHLQAHINLFDCWHDYGDINGSKSWIDAIVKPYAGRAAVWELQNQLPLDQPGAGPWVQSVFPFLKQVAGNTLYTISVTDTIRLAELQELKLSPAPDLFSMTWYPNDVTWTSAFSDTLAEGRKIVDPVPLLIGEVGASSYTWSEESEADLYQDVLYYSAQRGLDRLGVWTLYDFPAGTRQCTDTVPPADELHFGLYRTDGSAKPAAAIVRAAWHDGHYPSGLSPSRLLNGSFADWNADALRFDNWWAWHWPRAEQWQDAYWAARDCTVARSGGCSARLQGPGSLAVGAYNVPALRVDPTRPYTVEAYARAEHLAGWARLALSCQDRDGKWLGQYTADLTAPDAPDWTRLRIDHVRLWDQAAYCQVFVELYSTGAEARAWFDDVAVLRELYLPLMVRGPGS